MSFTSAYHSIVAFQSCNTPDSDFTNIMSMDPTKSGNVMKGTFAVTNPTFPIGVRSNWAHKAVFAEPQSSPEHMKYHIVKFDGEADVLGFGQVEHCYVTHSLGVAAWPVAVLFKDDYVMIASESGTTAEPCTSSQCPVFIHNYEVDKYLSCKDKVKKTVISYGATSRLRVRSYKVSNTDSEMLLMFDEVGQNYIYITSTDSIDDPSSV